MGREGRPNTRPHKPSDMSALALCISHEISHYRCRTSERLRIDLCALRLLEDYGKK